MIKKDMQELLLQKNDITFIDEDIFDEVVKITVHDHMMFENGKIISLFIQNQHHLLKAKKNNKFTPN